MTEAEELELLELEAMVGGAPQEVDPWAATNQQVSDTVQEEHPEITWKDRLVVKNLASSPEATLKYLKKEHPDLDIQNDPVTGQVKIKGMGEGQYKVLDPEGVNSFTEFAKDVGDVGYDILSGIGSGVATAAGGVAGALGGAGVGAIPGAMAAGAGSSAALEALRQGAGSALGIEDNIDPTQIGIAGLGGGLSPLLMGTGATAANLAGKGLAGKIGSAAAPELKSVLEKGLGRGIADVGADVALQQQKGAISRVGQKAVEKLLPSVASKLAGVTKADVDDLAKNTGIVKNFEQNPESIEKAISSTVDDAGAKFRTKLTDLNTQIEKKLAEEVGDKINIASALEPWEQKLKELATAAQVENATPADIQAYEGFKQTFETVFGKPKAKAVPGVGLVKDPKYLTRTPKQVRTIQENISELANWDQGLRVQSGAAELNPAERVINLTAKGSYELMNKALPESVQALKTKQAELIKNREFLQSVVNTPKKFISTMNQASQDKLQNKMLNTQLQEIDKLIGSKLDSARGAVNAANKFGTDVGWFDVKKRGPSALLGAVGGYYASRGGQGEGFNVPGVTAGAALGGALGGPRAVRALLEAARKGGTGKIAPAVQFGAKPVWNMMTNRDNVEK